MVFRCFGRRIGCCSARSRVRYAPRLPYNCLKIILSYLQPNPAVYTRLALVSRPFYCFFMADAHWRVLNPYELESGIAQRYIAESQVHKYLGAVWENIAMTRHEGAELLQNAQKDCLESVMLLFEGSSPGSYDSGRYAAKACSYLRDYQNQKPQEPYVKVSYRVVEEKVTWRVRLRRWLRAKRAKRSEARERAREAQRSGA